MICFFYDCLFYLICAGIARSNGDGTFSQAFYSAGGIAGYKIGSLRDRALAFDYNGDGTFEPAYLSTQGIGGYRITSERDRAFAFDYNGNGRSDIFFYRPDSGLAAVVRSGDKFPDLLSTLDNGVGATTEIEYTPSSRYTNALLPFIVHPVSKITIKDGWGNLSVSDFSYSGGLFDFRSREFRGFETAIQINPDETKLQVWFHQDEWFKGRQFRQQHLSPPEIGAVLSNTTMTWDKIFLDESDTSAAFVKLLQKRTEFYDGLTVFSQEDYLYDDASGNLLSKTTSGTDAEDVTISYGFLNLGDWLWRKTQETLEGSSSGLSITATDPDGGSKTEKKDYLGRIIQVVEHADQENFITTYEYNAAGDLLRVTDHYQNATAMNYDTLGRKISMNDPDMGYWEYTYDAGGNLATQTDEKLQTIKFAYDELNRLGSKTYSTFDPAVTYTYDNLLIPNGRGRLYAVSNSHATTTYDACDEMGNVTSVSKIIAGDPAVYTTRYVYDLSGKVVRTVYPDGYQVSNTYYAGTGLC